VTVRVVVVDDQEIVRAGFAALLETQDDFEVRGTAADGEEAVRVCRERRPDVVLMDIRMPVLDGIEATRQLVAGDTVAGSPRRALRIASISPPARPSSTFSHRAHGYACMEQPKRGEP
jgi:DNA-binding NarL/FixJ family response regulator